MIEFKQVTKHYPNSTIALDKITFSVSPGEFVFVVGPSGAGKTTLVKLLTREELPTEGEIRFGERDIASLRPGEIIQHRRDLGVVYQDYRLLSKKTAFENVALALEVLGRSDQEIKEIVPHALSLVGLEERGEHFPHQLSGGEQQRLAIARALVHEPKAFIADEPTGNIDPETAWGIIKLLEKINKMGTTILVATHAAHIVNKLNERVVELERGRVVRDQRGGKYGSS
ncbi:cell division ATP-binding protein FtsE [candidate division WWE3 bacterium CG10_big_fil_rev_8_21_14_0_10_48_23]|uniref:Cell division ATP-binding protein FtsE n=1 Tax=candidate division WWE3 bacterium CG_4_9_14_0_2_um_filter_48_10 TaxID=1975078 RepID=A0A2M8EIL7_UNCKA|nr:MAG: cell division ATP-binding protein FtsE [candidate division WWE3 bacterium CG_4_9_14_0_2_um_filter_48_10]PJE52217.1 MAG: cell division ATP-binding protein FtsE [candidate division WWE3 bacterium CG10_big_fil_rev_8_21_14_0_10_48_23]